MVPQIFQRRQCCTNSRIEDLRAAAAILRERKVAAGVRLLVVPGSQAIKRDAEAEGIDAVVRAAGGEWRESGCSMCIAMNGDSVGSGKYSVSTSNRNLEGRQGEAADTGFAGNRHRYRSDHSGPVPDDDSARGSRQTCIRGLALRRKRHADRACDKSALSR